MAESSSAAAGVVAEEEGNEEGERQESAVVHAMDAAPFLLHVLLVLVVTWLVVPVTFTGLLFVALFNLYLVYVETRGREIERQRIASAERQKLNTRRTFGEGETSRWLNEGIKSMWPVSMEKFVSKHFFGPMAPHFLDRYKPWMVKEAKMDIESLRLGSNPPVFNFIRALEKPPDGDHLAFEADMDFCAGNDMNAEMSIQLKGGARTTFYISNLHIQGKVRISAKFLKGWPVVELVRFCFATTPQVSMSYMPYYKNFPDVSLFPVLENMVKKTLDNAMVHSIVEPNMLVVDIAALASMLSPDSRGVAAAKFVSQADNKPTLLVEILDATNLKVADRNGFSDPFVDIQFGQKKKRTKYIKKTLNPKWENEQHKFIIENWSMPNFLNLWVRDWNRLRNFYDLGIYTVSLNDLYLHGNLHEDGTRYEFGKRYVFYRRLDKVSRGHLRFAITVNSTTPPQASEEPCTSDAVCETVTQEIQSAVDYVVHNSPGINPELKRSKSDTNLDDLGRAPLKRHKKKWKHRHNTTHDSRGLRALQEQQTMVAETHDVITMPYGPHGAFTILHPGSVIQTPYSAMDQKTRTAQPVPHATADALGDEEEGMRSSSRLSNMFRGLVRKRRPSQENIVLGDTRSEQSGSVCSDFSSELRSFEPETYRGSVRMDLIHSTAATNSIAPQEPPEMFISKSAPLETIMSENPSSSVPDPSTEVRTNGYHGEESTARNKQLGSPPTMPVAGGREQLLPEEGKPVTSLLPKSWYKKIKTLAAKAGTKKTKKKVQDHANGAVPYSCELNGDGCTEDSDPTVSRSVSFTGDLSPGVIDGGEKHTPGESPELRKLVRETLQSRAAGSQSDRSNWASRVTQRIRDQSKSLRLESLHLKPKLAHKPDASQLNSIPERPPPGPLHQHRNNGKLSI